MANGIHTHGYHDPRHNHGENTGESLTRFIGFAWDMTCGKDHLSDHERHSHTIPIGHTGITIHSGGHHSHDISGSTASTSNCNVI